MADLPGKAIHDFYFQENKKRLFVHDRFGPKVEMPVSTYFRNATRMPQLERIALDRCSGNILDIGAGAGTHSLELQNRGFQCTALEISPKACEVITAKGVENVVCEDFFKFEEKQFDTLLLLMNGIGICATVGGFRTFLKKAKSLLKPDGKIVFDSCDVAYMYEDISFPEYYYGEVECRYEYQGELTDWFGWLYIDQHTMKSVAEEEGWISEIIFEDDRNQYLAELYLGK